MDYIIAFVVGGSICALVQILMDKTKLMPGRIMVILVCLGTLLGALGIYEPFAEWAQAPSLHSMQRSVIQDLWHRHHKSEFDQDMQQAKGSPVLVRRARPASLLLFFRTIIRVR